jgi:hypothetical protein
MGLIENTSPARPVVGLRSSRNFRSFRNPNRGYCSPDFVHEIPMQNLLIGLMIGAAGMFAFFMWFFYSANRINHFK